MIRFVFLLLLTLLCVWVALQVLRSARNAKVDWTGITFIVGFVALAFYLRHVTELG